MKPKPQRGQSAQRVGLARSTVQRIVVEKSGGGPRATGVVYRTGGRTAAGEVTARATREVIVSAGALESPKLLMLSGIGPVEELVRHGIDVVVEQPYVGRNLMDHPNVQVFFRGHQPTDCNWAQLYGFHRANPASDLKAGAPASGNSSAVASGMTNRSRNCWISATVAPATRASASNRSPSCTAPRS